MIHPLEYGQIIASPGCHFSYRVIGPCCQLFDREQLPWPCCRLQWRGKEPSWRRIGRQFVLDMATRGHPTYSVEILDPGYAQRRGAAYSAMPVLLTLYWVNLPQPMNEWWYSDRLKRHEGLAAEPPRSKQDFVTSSKSGGLAEDRRIEG